MEILHRLQHSKFRRRFKLREKEREYVRKKNFATIRDHAFSFISERIGPAKPCNDGTQTPMKNHPVFIAQHATATCCRTCVETWHHIPRGRALNHSEISYLVDVIMSWLEGEFAHT
ncbi:MAG: DUF4186 domain-containing protein [Candidatus Omnitrophica bacterium]|nr:DUF4186 domain-containing protein [Candidatus Omnitrophota bacterium]